APASASASSPTRGSRSPCTSSASWRPTAAAAPAPTPSTSTLCHRWFPSRPRRCCPAPPPPPAAPPPASSSPSRAPASTPTPPRQAAPFNPGEGGLLAPAPGLTGHTVVSAAGGAIREGSRRVARGLVPAGGALGSFAAFKAGTPFLTQLHDDLGALLDAGL